MLFGNVTEDIVHLVDDTALALRRREVTSDGVYGGLMSVADPQVDMLHALPFQVSQEVLPGVLVLFLTNQCNALLTWSHW
jgi:hypothetical protein